MIDSRVVSDMPFSGRRALELTKLIGGAVFINYAGQAKANFSLAGGRVQNQMFWLDGGNIQNMRLGIGQVDTDPPVEVIKEFRVVQNGYAAEYGGSASGLIISTTKSGTNQIHGSAFEFFRNDAMDAAGFFAPIQDGTETPRAATLQPIWRHARRARSSRTAPTSSAAMRAPGAPTAPPRF
jgi:hypothetical protein